MTPKKILSILLILLGEILIISLFLHFGNFSETRILILNIVVTTIIYSLLFLRLILPMVDFNDRAQRSIVSLGAGWFFTGVYIVLSFAAMLAFTFVRPLDFAGQLIIHGILIFILLLGFYYSFSASEKTGSVYTAENHDRAGIADIKREFGHIMQRLSLLNNLPSRERERITDLHENIRYISPANTNESRDIENRLLQELILLRSTLSPELPDYEKLNSTLDKCEYMYNERKQVFSN